MSPTSPSSPSLYALVLAAGQGKRMLSKLPKVLHPVGDRPMVHHPVALALGLGAEHTVVVVPPGASAVPASLSAEFGEQVRFAVQEEPNGTADAVRAGLGALGSGDGTLLILCGDVPNLDPEAVASLLQAKATAQAPVALLSFTTDVRHSYGRVVRAADGSVTAIVEARDATAAQLAVRELNSGIYAVDLGLLRELLTGVRADNAQQELYLTDIVALAATRGLPVVAAGVDVDSVAGVNDRVDLARAHQVWRERRNLRCMRQGVTMEDPDSTFIGSQVVIAADVTLEPRVRLTGRSSVAAGARIATGCVLHDTVVRAGARLHPYTVSDGAVIGGDSDVGPFARLRPGTVLGERVRVGNFVETKKTTLGDGSKASHLTYLGDATLGRDVNVGCGTITCNYDGYGKYPTVIGDGCLIGSDTALVAPVRLGDQAVTGAGSVITNDVPAGALAVSRGRQRNVKDYYRRLRERYHRDED